MKLRKTINLLPITFIALGACPASFPDFAAVFFELSVRVTEIESNEAVSNARVAIGRCLEPNSDPNCGAILENAGQANSSGEVLFRETLVRSCNELFTTRLVILIEYAGALDRIEIAVEPVDEQIGVVRMDYIGMRFEGERLAFEITECVDESPSMKEIVLLNEFK